MQGQGLLQLEVEVHRGPEAVRQDEARLEVNQLQKIRNKIKQSLSRKKTKFGYFSSNIDMSKPMPRVRYSVKSPTRRFR